MSVQLVHCSDMHLDKNFNISNLARARERKDDLNNFVLRNNMSRYKEMICLLSTSATDSDRQELIRELFEVPDDIRK
jgi:hypothetical protein